MWPQMSASQKTLLSQDDFHPIYPPTTSSRERRQSKLTTVLNCAIFLVPALHKEFGLSDTTSRGPLTYIENDSSEAREYYNAFGDFLRKFNKGYSKSEIQFRFRVYVRNAKMNQRRNDEDPNVVFGETQFSDWTDAELKKILLSAEEPRLDDLIPFNASLLNDSSASPTAFNWVSQGKVSPIKNQGNCGSCWAFASVATIESQYAIRKGHSIAELLSEQQLVDCDLKSFGCQGGYTATAMEYSSSFLKQEIFSYAFANGLTTNTEYSYRGVRQACRIQRGPFWISAAHWLPKNEAVMVDWLVNRGPFTIIMSVTNEMFHYRGGVFNPSRTDCQERMVGRHAVAVVGYGSEGGQDFWIVKNSWGELWGENGYFRLARGVDSCGMAEYVVAPVVN